MRFWHYIITLTYLLTYLLGSRAFRISAAKNMEFLTSSHSAVSNTLFI